MPQGPSQAPPALPRWVAVVATVAILVHFTAFSMRVLAARSGPWSTDIGPTPMEPPAFAAAINSLTSPAYLDNLGLGHEYQFLSNRTNLPAVKLEIRVLDKFDKVVKTLNLPDPQANYWVQERQRRLAASLGDDQPIATARRNVVPAPGQERPRFMFFYNYGAGPTKPFDLYHAEEPPDNVFGPSNWALALAKSYARYVRDHEAGHHGVKVEVVRRSRTQINPSLALLPNPLPGTFDELVCNFGDGKQSKLYRDKK